MLSVARAVNAALTQRLACRIKHPSQYNLYINIKSNILIYNNINMAIITTITNPNDQYSYMVSLGLIW